MIAFAILVVVFLFVVSTYNGFIRRRNIVDEGWSGIDIQLKRRSDLVPNLVETVKGYAEHEKTTFEEVVTLRNRASAAISVTDKSQAESALSSGIGKLFALAENYPQLRANENFKKLQDQLSEIEEQIQFARRFYNGAVRDYNIAVQSFPGNLLAGLTGFSPRSFFQLEDAAERTLPKVELSHS